MEIPDDQQPEQKRSSGSSCLLYGCLIAFLAMVVLVVGGGFLGYRFLRGQLEQYTDDAPAELPMIELTDEEIEEIQGRIDSFQETLEKGDTPEDLILTADELNALISKNEDLKGRVFITIQEGQVSGDVSIPTEFIPGGTGRYFNASATFDVSLSDGVLIVTLAAAEVKGEPVTQDIIQAMSSENLARDVYNDPEVAAILRRFESLTIDDEQIILSPRLEPSEPGEQSEPAEPAEPSDPGEHSAAGEHSEPGEHGEPAGPSEPVDPGEHSEPAPVAAAAADDDQP